MTLPRLSVVQSADSHRKTATTVNALMASSADAMSVASRAQLASAPISSSVLFDGSVWTFDSSDLSTLVTADTRQGIYVAPSSDTSGASGAWVRQYTGAKDARWFGAVGDGTTDDATALQGWLDSGGALYLPPLKFRSASELIVRKCVKLTGAAYGFDNRIVGYSNMPGSKIAFDAGVAGLDIQPQWTGLDWSNTTATQEGAFGSVIEHIGLIGGGGATATGVHLRTLVHLRDVTAEGFSGKGFDIAGGAAAGNNGESGDADFTTLKSCHAISNGGNGFHLRGTDANVIKLDSCNASSNGGWGFYTESEFANTFINCHTSVNTLGSYKATGIVSHVFVGCYDEGGTGAACDISAPAAVVGGLLAGVAATSNAHSGGPMPIIISGDGYSTYGALHINSNAWNSGAGAILSTDSGVIAGSSIYSVVIQGASLGTDADVALVDHNGNPFIHNAAGTTRVIVPGVVEIATHTVATLPTGIATGARSFVTDSTVGASGNFGAVVAGGGANPVPVWFNGVGWIIG